MSDSLELKAAKQRVKQVFMDEFITLCRYDRSELVDSLFGDMVTLQHRESEWDEMALKWRHEPEKAGTR